MPSFSPPLDAYTVRPMPPHFNPSVRFTTSCPSSTKSLPPASVRTTTAMSATNLTRRRITNQTPDRHPYPYIHHAPAGADDDVSLNCVQNRVLGGEHSSQPLMSGFLQDQISITDSL